MTQLKADHVDDCGWLIKGWGHSEEVLREVMEEYNADFDDGASAVDLYERREIWVRKFNQPKDAEYAWLMQETDPHARGAGRFTFIDADRPTFRQVFPS